MVIEHMAPRSSRLFVRRLKSSDGKCMEVEGVQGVA